MLQGRKFILDKKKCKYKKVRHSTLLGINGLIDLKITHESFYTFNQDDKWFGKTPSYFICQLSKERSVIEGSAF